MNIDDEASKRPDECDLNYGCKANDSANTTERSSLTDELNCPCDQVNPCIGLSEPVTSSSCISCFSKATSSSVSSYESLINFADVTPDFQIYEIFQRWKLKPDIIIEYDCPNDEILALLKNSYRSSPSISENAENESVILSPKFSDSNCSTVNVSSESCKCDLPSEKSFTDNVKILNTRLKVYSKFANTTVKKMIYNTIPQNVIYVDGRYPVDHAIAVVKVKLQLMSCRVPLVPEQCDESQNLEDDAESLCAEANDNDECESESSSNGCNENCCTMKRAFNHMKHYPSPMNQFKCQLSRWKFNCPVKLAEGKQVQGKRKFAVRFMNWIFFLSSEKAMQAFIENPRPYLLPPQPRAGCRLAVCGPRFTKKTEVSQKLAKFYNVPVINVNELINGYDPYKKPDDTLVADALSLGFTFYYVAVARSGLVNFTENLDDLSKNWDEIARIVGKGLDVENIPPSSARSLYDDSMKRLRDMNLVSRIPWRSNGSSLPRPKPLTNYKNRRFSNDSEKEELITLMFMGYFVFIGASNQTNLKDITKDLKKIRSFVNKGLTVDENVEPTVKSSYDNFIERLTDLDKNKLFQNLNIVDLNQEEHSSFDENNESFNMSLKEALAGLMFFSYFTYIKVTNNDCGFEYVKMDLLQIWMFVIKYINVKQMSRPSINTDSTTVDNIKSIQSLGDASLTNAHPSMDRKVRVSTYIYHLSFAHITYLRLRNDEWILDDMVMDLQQVQMLMDIGFNVETVVLPNIQLPYDNFIENFRTAHSNDTTQTYENEASEDFDAESHSISEKNNHLEELYRKELDSYRQNINTFTKQLHLMGIDTVFYDLKIEKDSVKHVLAHLEKKYKSEMYVPFEKEGDCGTDEFLKTDKSEENKNQFGDSNIYCPVALRENNVLWKGSSKFKCLLDDKVYYFCCEAAKNKFLDDPSPFPLQKPLSNFPPPLRIVIIGPVGSGRSTLANRISKELGLAHIDFYKRFDEYLSDRRIDVRKLKMSLMNNDDDNAEMDDDYEEEEENGSNSDFAESLDDLKYVYDKQAIIDFYKKYPDTGTSLPTCIAKECIANLFKAPYDTCGVVINSFPNCIQDVQMMFEKFVIPDLVVELYGNTEKCKKRLFNKLFKDFMDEERAKEIKNQEEYCAKMKDYEDFKKEWMKNERMKIQNGAGNEALLRISSNESFESTQSIIAQSMKAEDIEQMFHRLYPAPKLKKNILSKEYIKKFLLHYIEIKSKRFDAKLKEIIHAFQDRNIRCIKVDAHRNIERIFIEVLYNCTPLVQRNSSVLEITEEIPNIQAEHLLRVGYYFLSPFGRRCPVQAYYNKNPFYMFVPLACQQEIFTVVHRRFVYFIATRRAVEKFKEDPLKYLSKQPRVPFIPALISVIGPPMSGKTTLSQRFSSIYDFECISRDEAINYVLDNFDDSKLACDLREVFGRDGKPTALQFAKVVKLFLSNLQCVLQGCVFDGFPANEEETSIFKALDIQPIVVIDLEVTVGFLSERYETAKQQGIYSNICQEYIEWTQTAKEFRESLQSDFNNLIAVDATMSKFGVWLRADEAVRFRYTKYFEYIGSTGTDVIRDVEFSCLPKSGILEKASKCQLYCPLCIHFHETFQDIDIDKCRRGLLKFRGVIYWFCGQHIKMFTEDPVNVLEIIEKLKLPEEYPRIIEESIDIEDECWAKCLVNGGYCVITYIENLPNRDLTRGKPDLAVMYKDQVYLFCSEECREKFLKHFPVYTSIIIQFPHTLEPVDLKCLPNIGFLEQNLGPMLVKAVSRVGGLRPKFPGLSVSQSALIYAGVYLKILQGKNSSELYESVLERMENRCMFFRQVANCMKNRPTLHHESTKDTLPKMDYATRPLNEQTWELPRQSVQTVTFRRTSATEFVTDQEDI
ncbi:adenylate kinase 9-like [Trichogramma pretiosum]|uniref:adenylate kinase 9-like n=1 Tax=Trichogramma pretiosum TaxID=7493 RepID=UPI000C71AFF2|nr:adenylate kinase 9-like [Trichogramma pretiosum]